MQPCVNAPVGAWSYGTVLPANELPFTATERRTFDQTLADGNTIHIVSTSTVARSTSGITRNERVPGCVRDTEGNTHVRSGISIYDPNTHESRSFNMDSGRVMSQSSFLPQPSGSIAYNPLPYRVAAQHNNVNEKLGIRTMQGCEAEGVRNTQTIPARTEGNRDELKISQEIWTCQKWKVRLLYIVDDPRRGRETTELIDIRLGEPAPPVLNPQ